ncbi:MAG: hypothetical protein WD009_05285 [Phycisphaeraceae bacterium]
MDAYLADPTDPAWRTFRQAYLKLLRERFETDPRPFDALAERAHREDVFIGCSCPTRANPDPARCHTILALGFMRRQYPDLGVQFPAEVDPPDVD